MILINSARMVDTRIKVALSPIARQYEPVRQ